MRFSLLSLFGVMTVLAIVLGLPAVAYGLGGLILVVGLGGVAGLFIVRAGWEMGIAFFEMFASRPRLPGYLDPRTGGDTNAGLPNRAIKKPPRPLSCTDKTAEAG